MKNETLVEAVADISGASFLGIDTVTQVKLKGGKKNPMQGRVTKHTTGSQVVAFGNSTYNGYMSSIRNRLIKEGKNPDDYKPGERAWGTRVPNMPIIEHIKDDVTNYYLEAIFLKAGETVYKLDGEVIEIAEIEGLEPAAEPTETAQGGLDEKIIIRTLKAESIIELRVNHKKYN